MRGPNVKVLVEKKNQTAVQAKFIELFSRQQVILAHAGKESRLGRKGDVMVEASAPGKTLYRWRIRSCRSRASCNHRGSRSIRHSNK